MNHNMLKSSTNKYFIFDTDQGKAFDPEAPNPSMQKNKIKFPSYAKPVGLWELLRLLERSIVPPSPPPPHHHPVPH
jgi:hypothetical protein